MIMSITERTREIGVMKSLGCFVRDVRTVFLLEAGCIGLLGGLVGIVASGLNSVVMNLFSNRAAVTSFSAALAVLGEKGSRISVIPVWLVLFCARLFSIDRSGVGLLSRQQSGAGFGAGGDQARLILAASQLTARRKNSLMPRGGLVESSAGACLAEGLAIGFPSSLGNPMAEAEPDW